MNEKRPLNGKDVRVVWGACHVDMDMPAPDRTTHVTFIHQASFNPDEIDYRIEFIRRSLAELPVELQEASGAPFFHGLMNQNGELWGLKGSEWDDLEKLFQLGMAAGLVELFQPQVEGPPFVRVTLFP